MGVVRRILLFVLGLVGLLAAFVFGELTVYFAWEERDKVSGWIFAALWGAMSIGSLVGGVILIRRAFRKSPPAGKPPEPPTSQVSNNT